MFTVEFPYEIGEFVLVSDSYDSKPSNRFINEDDIDSRVGTVSCYNCVTPNEFCIVVSGYKQPWCGEFLESQIRVLDNKEVEFLKGYHESLKL